MSKSDYEITAEIVQELLKARSQAIAGVNLVATQTQLIEKYLSDEAVVKAYKEIFRVVNRPMDE